MRILLVKTSSLGDVVHNLPVASDIARHCPDAQIDWLVEEAFAEIPRLHPAVGTTIPVALRRWRRHLHTLATWREIRAFRHRLRAVPYDVILDSQGLLKSALLAVQARGRRVGHARNSAREPLAARFYEDRIAVSRGLHAVTRNRLLAAGAFAYAISGPADYGIAAPPLAAAWLPPAPYAVLLTATSRADKEWAEPAWADLGAALRDLGVACVLPGGTAGERERAARLAARLAGGVAAPPLNLTGMAGLLAGAALVVGVDTGLVHLAVALGRPTLALYCASDPSLTGVHGGDGAVSLGRRGQPPSAAEVVAHAGRLLA